MMIEGLATELAAVQEQLSDLETAYVLLQQEARELLVEVRTARAVVLAAGEFVCHCPPIPDGPDGERFRRLQEAVLAMGRAICV